MTRVLATKDQARPADAVSTVTATEEGRAFYQRRLSIFGLCLFILAGGSWLVLSLATLVGPAEARIQDHPVFSTGSLLHLTNGLLAGALWLATRRGRTRSSVLHALDLGVCTGLILVWGGAGLTLPNPVAGAFISLLSYIMGTLSRAIIVPSTAERTFTIGVIGAVVIVCFILIRDNAYQRSIAGAIAAACWSASAITIGTVASHTIFGLRREVQQARVFGQYTLDTQIGEGGMGSVWRASHALLRRPTAVKLLPPERMGEGAVKRFEREVQLTARLTHPNTVAIYDYGRTREGIFYYAMELIEGTDLERLVIEHGPQPPGRVIHVLTQICGALAEAHDLGLVHRDVKPANILLALRRNEHEFAKIVDFGLVKTLVEAGSPEPALSSTNTITGTPLYLSPEAIRGSEVDARSDLYALGAVAWFLLVGRPVFTGPSVVAVCGHHLHSTPTRPSDVLDHPVPSDLEDVILACLEKDPRARPSDARALRARLEACRSAGEWSVELATEWWRRHPKSEIPTKPAGITTRTIALDVGARSPRLGQRG